MYTKSIKPTFGAFANEVISFSKSINVIRGSNGIGKSEILEIASIVGHISDVPLIELSSTSDLVTIEVCIE